MISGALLCLIQIWLPDYYLTCDGPCHLYNASIVHDLWRGNNTDFYNTFYQHAYSIDPNSLTTYAMALLLFVAKGAVAEKLFLTAYALTYLSGIWVLMRRLSGHTISVWFSGGFIFLFTYALSKGFYNFSLGVAFWLWMVWAWIRYIDKPRLSALLIYFIFSSLTFFTHLLPFVFGLITTGPLLVSYGLAAVTDKRRTLLNLAAWAAAATPFVIFTLLFTQKEGGLRLTLAPHPFRLLELVEFKYIINVVNTERPWALLAGAAIGALVILTMVRSISNFKWHKYDGFMAALVIIAFVYTFFPEDFLGRAIIISIRAQLFVMLLAAMIIGYRMKDGALKNAGGILLFASFFVLSIIRMECRHDASMALKGILEAGKMIPERSIVLTIDGAPGGRGPYGNTIADRNAIFHHATHYIACGKPLIMLDNYEANTGYFPIGWRNGTNPYIHLSLNGGFENNPPTADIMNYERMSGQKIGYIIARSFSPAADGPSAELRKQIDSNYEVILTDVGHKTQLMARKHN
jgi:hypothetical protein